MKNNRGITLIALVITIIVMLILAGVALYFTIGENGILEKSKEATVVSRETEAKEEVATAWASAKTDSIKHLGKPKSEIFTVQNLNNYLRNKGEVLEVNYNYSTDSTLKYKSNNQGWEYLFAITKSGNVKTLSIEDGNGNIIKTYVADSEDINGDGNTCTVTLNANDTSENLDFLTEDEKDDLLVVINPKKITINSGEMIGMLPEPRTSLWFVRFAGWYTEPTGGDLITSQTVVNNNITLYAHWTEISCFVAGTKVLTDAGMKNIEDINLGENVYTLNTDINERQLNKVTKIYENTTNDMCEIITDNSIIKCTPRHEIFIVDKGYTRAYNINKGDFLLGKNNKLLEIKEIRYTHLENPVKVYNLSVESNYNYLVTESEILVHNVRSPSSCPFNFLISELSTSTDIELPNDFYIDIYDENEMNEEEKTIIENFQYGISEAESASDVFVNVKNYSEDEFEIPENAYLEFCSDMIKVENYDNDYEDINCLIKDCNMVLYNDSDFIFVIGMVDDDYNTVNWAIPNTVIDSDTNTIDMTLPQELMRELEESSYNVLCVLNIGNY